MCATPRLKLRMPWPCRAFGGIQTTVTKRWEGEVAAHAAERALLPVYTICNSAEPVTYEPTALLTNATSSAAAIKSAVVPGLRR